MAGLARFGVSVEEDLLASFDRLIAMQGYGNRSEALRDLMRDTLVKQQVEQRPERKDVLASLTLVYDHHVRELGERMTEIQHDNPGLVVSVLHIHVSHEDCMEVIVLRGKLKQVRGMANLLLSLKGVKHGHLFLTLPGQEITDGGRAETHEHRHGGQRHTHGPAAAPASSRRR